MKPRNALLLMMIFAAAALRLLPHPSNFEPVGALALFAGAHLEKRRAFLIPLAAMLLSDALIGFHSQLPVVYAAFALIACMGFSLKGQVTASAVTISSFAASLLFFVVTNLGVWMFDALYPHTVTGLIACYVAALPFLSNSIAGTLFYSAVLFGGFALAERKLPAFAPAHSG